MQRLEVSVAVRPLYGSLGVKGLRYTEQAEGQLRSFLTSPINGSKWSKSRPGRFKVRPGTHSIGDQVGSSEGLEELE